MVVCRALIPTAAAAILLAGCGSSSSDQVASVVRQAIAGSGASRCDSFSDQFLTRLTQSAPSQARQLCRSTATRLPRAKAQITGVTVHGAQAEVKATSNGRRAVYTLSKHAGRWQVDSVTSSS